MDTSIVFPADFELHIFPELYDSTTRTNFALDVTSSKILALHDNVLLAIRVLQTMNEDRAVEDLQRRGLPASTASESVNLVKRLINTGDLQARTEETKMKPPWHNYTYFMNLNLAHACNLACRYCFAASGTYNSVGGEGLMTWNVAKAAIDYLSTQPTASYHIGLFGGEPLLNKTVIKQLLPYAKETLKRKTRISISTNGVLLDEEMVELLSAYDCEIQISCDGGRYLQNELRPGKAGVESFKGVVDAVKAMKNKGYQNYRARTTVTRLCPSQKDLMLQLMSLGFERMNFQPAFDQDLGLSPEQLEKYCAEFKDLAKFDAGIRTGYLGGVFRVVKGAIRKGFFCTAGFCGVTVGSDGSMYACQRLIKPEYRIGDVWKGKDMDKVNEMFPNHTVDEHEPCSSCWARYFCGGGCYAENLRSNGSTWKPWSLRCHMFKAALEAIIEHQFVEPARRALRARAGGGMNETIAVAQT